MRIHLFYSTQFFFQAIEVLSFTLLVHLSVPYTWIEINIRKNWWQKNTYSCNHQLAVFLSIIKTFNSVNILVGTSLGYFYLISSELWMNLIIQVTRSPMPSASAWPVVIWFKLSNFYTIGNSHVQSLSYQKCFMGLSTLETTEFISPSVNHIFIGAFIFNILVKHEELCAARGCQNSTKLE